MTVVCTRLSLSDENTPGRAYRASGALRAGRSAVYVRICTMLMQGCRGGECKGRVHQRAGHRRMSGDGECPQVAHTTGGGSLLCLLAFPLARACLVEVVQRKEERDDEHLVGKWW